MNKTSAKLQKMESEIVQTAQLRGKINKLSIYYKNKITKTIASTFYTF